MAKKMAFSAIMMALAVLCLFGASTLPSAKISVLALTSVFGTVCVAEYGAKYGMIHYVGVSLLSLLLIPKKMMVIIYLLFIGYYPIVKMYVERLNKRWLEWILKLLIFNLFLVLAFFVFRTFFLPSLESILAKIAVYYLPAVVVLLEAVFVIYDYVLSYIISYYYQVLQAKIHGGQM
ncbi:MAG: hypothetical protein IJA08_03550 [Clostridia bacterium]|nr:hypothetical protein [Clostridia bacterium]